MKPTTEAFWGELNRLWDEQFGKKVRALRALRAVGAVLGILGTAFVVGVPSAFGLGPSTFVGYCLWFLANCCWIAVGLIRRDGWSVAMFVCYQAATVWGLVMWRIG